MSAQISSVPAAPPDTAGRGSRLRLLWGLAALVLVIDQLTKAWALAALADGTRRPLLGPLLGLRLVFNPGAAFSFATGQTWVLTLVSVLAVGFVLRVSRRLGSRTWAVALALVLGGATGNLVDRLLRAPGAGRGHVVDFIDYGVFVGNVADIAIVGAAALIMWLSVTGRELDSAAAAPDQPGTCDSQTGRTDPVEAQVSARTDPEPGKQVAPGPQAAAPEPAGPGTQEQEGRA